MGDADGMRLRNADALLSLLARSAGKTGGMLVFIQYKTEPTKRSIRSSVLVFEAFFVWEWSSRVESVSRSAGGDTVLQVVMR